MARKKLKTALGKMKKQRKASKGVARTLISQPKRRKKSQPPPREKSQQAPAVESSQVNKLYVVGIGASAGGLHAFEQFFNATPVNSGFAFVVVPHLDPNHVSILPDLLAKFTEIPVVRIENGQMLEPDHVYVVPQNNHLSIEGRHLVLHEFNEKETRGSRLPIDFFLRSLARAFEDRAIGVLLSGNGSDGSLGLREIKGAGGLVLAQDPSTAQYPGLPQSAIDTGLVDFILPPGKMPERLVSYVNQLTDKLDDDHHQTTNNLLDQIYGLIQQRTGHDFSCYKKNTVVRRIERRLHVHQLTHPGEYVKFIEEHPEEAESLFKELLIGVTSFFRDKEAFECLKEKVLPSWLSNKPDDYVLRVWIPGCSGGEETYSLAMLLNECLTEFKAKMKVQLFGTDIDAEAIERARAGVYPHTIESDVSPERLRRFFTKKGERYQIRKDIREMCIFAPQNVVRDPPFTKMDFVSCRNLLIYMDGELQKKLLPLFHYSLRPDGILFLGTSESIGNFTDLFSVMDKKWKIYRRKETLARHILFNFHTPPAVPTLSPTLKEKEQAATLRDAVEQSLLDKYSPSSAVINEKGDVLYIHGRTGKYLEPSTGHASLNLLNMARDGLRLELASAVRKAIARRKDVFYEGVRVRSNGGHQLVNISVRHLRKPPQLQGLLLVAFETPSAETIPNKQSKALVSGRESRLLEIERELKYTREHLQTTIEELETSNEELKSTNEELQSTNEELQSSNEELETSKEELQSLNEELVTVNGELQSKFDELATANNDMMNLLNSTHVPTIFVDNHLNVKRFTTEATRIINLIYSDIGRPIRHIASNLSGDDLEANIEKVITTLTSLEKEVRTKDDFWYNMSIVPYRTLENMIDGAVLTFNDITKQKSVEQQLKELAETAKINELAIAVLDMVQEALLVLDSDLRVLQANRPFIHIFGLDSEEIKGKFVDEIGGGNWLPIRHLLQDVISRNTVIENYHLDHEFASVGQKRLVLSARKTFSRGADAEVVLLSIKEISGGARKAGSSE